MSRPTPSPSAALDRLRFDVRYALRGLRRSPAFALTVIGTLALGIAANAAMFNVVDQLLFRPLAFLRAPEMVHRFYWQNQSRGETRNASSVPYARYLDLAKWTTSFSQMAAFSERPLAVGDGDDARELRVGTVSASFWSFFDAPPALGRYFTPDEDTTPVGASVVVLSYPYWQSAFGGRDVRGVLLTVGNVRATIIGVAPEGFNGVNDANPPSLFIPITTFAGTSGTGDARTYFSAYYWGWVNVLARRRDGVSLAQANTDATQAYRRSWEAARAMDASTPPVDDARPQIVVSSVRPGAGPTPALEARTALWVTVVAAIVLLIACANVANLVLARALQRQRETAVRLALGVTRGRLIVQALTESLVLSALGGVVAVLVAQWAGGAVRAILISNGTSTPPIATDGRTLLVTLAITLIVGVAVGLVPVLLLERGDLARTLRGGSRGVTAHGTGLRSSLLVVQGALSMVLLVGAALFVRSLQQVQQMPMGYDANHVLLVSRVLRGEWPGDSAMTQMSRHLLAEAQALPGVESAAWVNSTPFVSTSSSNIYVAGIDSTSRLGTFTYQATTADYFRTMRTRILRGRALGVADREGAPRVGVVSASMAATLWPGQEALGQCFRVRADTMPCTTVVGIAEDMVQRDLTGGQRYHFYIPIEQATWTHGNGMLLRLSGDPFREGENVRAALQRVILGASYVTVQPLASIVEDEQRSWRLGATMFVAFGGLALVVAAVGLYGVIGYNVAQRTRELGVRVALGARKEHILRLITGEGMRLTLLGVVLGGAVAAVAGRWIEPLLFRQAALDPAVYGGVAGTMLLVALAASAVPAWRAARADPNVALRSE